MAVNARARGATVAIVLVIALVTLAALPTLTYPLGRDQGEFAVIGRGLLRGDAPYRDLWNPKPPAVFLVYAGAIALGGESSVALRAIDLLLVFPLAALGIWGLTRLLGGSPALGVLTAALIGGFYFSETFWTLTQNDGIAIVPMIAAVGAGAAAGAAARDRRSWSALLWSLTAGALSGVCFWFKYNFALIAIAVVGAYGLIARRPHGRDLLAAIVGGVVVLAIGVASLASAGALEAWIASIRATTGYTALGFAELGESLPTALGFRWSHWGLLFLLSAAGVILGWRTLTGRLALIWVAVAAAILLVQAKGYDYHWLPLLPPLALLAALALERLTQGARWLRIPAIALLIAIMGAGVWDRALPYLRGQIDARTYAAGFVAGDFHADESLAFADFLRARVAPGDSLFIWGFRPEVYFESRLLPAIRFIFQYPLVADWYPPEWREEAVAILWAALPPYVAVVEGDYLRWVTGIDADSATLLRDYADLEDWLIYNYERDSQIGAFLIWRRKETVG